MDISKEELMYYLQGEWTLQGGIHKGFVEPDILMTIKDNTISHDTAFGLRTYDFDPKLFEQINTYTFPVPSLGFNLCYIYQITDKKMTCVLFKPNPVANEVISYDPEDLLRSPNAIRLDFVKRQNAS